MDKVRVARELVKLAQELIAIQLTKAFDRDDYVKLYHIISRAMPYATEIRCNNSEFPTQELKFTVYPKIKTKDYNEVEKAAEKIDKDISVNRRVLDLAEENDPYNLDERNNYSMIFFRL